MTKSFNAVLTIWVPMLIIVAAVFLFIAGNQLWVITLLAIGIALSMLADLKIKGTDIRDDERYKSIAMRSSDLSNRITATVLIILTCVHFFFYSIEGSIILIILLLTHYGAEIISSLFLSYKY